MKFKLFYYLLITILIPHLYFNRGANAQGEEKNLTSGASIGIYEKGPYMGIFSNLTERDQLELGINYFNVPIGSYDAGFSDKEIKMRRRLPKGIKMYTGDDFNYPELIEGDELGFSHALLGIFDPLAGVVPKAIDKLGAGDLKTYRSIVNPTVPLARQIFRPPTQFYKTGVVFLSWLNGFQDHFVMVNGAQSSRSFQDFVDIFKLADYAGILRDPEHAKIKMKRLMNMYGLT